MSLWGPALDAEVEYRGERLRQAWGGRPRKDRSKDAAKDTERRTARKPAGKRAAEIGRGVRGMRPAPAHRGLFA
ncbi:hypothetical protein [Myceligenerans xiligouense]|uniref:Uncharacterized protein n=1 Tax=Myceligenerans xiligouense TaxID=253184 RepID=A0A3N4YQ13_9MICO|nr:hypothetical protein [Myceligenerans xiligouense]RPF22703.1 hypothetical protein EDD34_3374 [Myceligenerans xiligouense]